MRDLLYPSEAHIRSLCLQPAFFEKPQELIRFSFDSYSAYEFNDFSLRYFIDPPAAADLTYGYERSKRRPQEKRSIDELLIAVSRIKRTIGEDAWSKTVIAWSDVIAKIMIAPYINEEGWEMNVMVIDNTFYFDEHISDENLSARETPEARLESYYDHSFASFCTRATPDQKQRGWGGDVDTNMRWCRVVKTKVASTKYLIGGKVDCLRNRTNSIPTAVQLRVTLTLESLNDEPRFERELLKYFMNALLLGVPEIVIGYRSPAGKLTTVHSFQTDSLPKMVRGKEHGWDPAACFHWGELFMAHLERLMNVDTMHFVSRQTPVWRVKFIPRMGVRIYLLHEQHVNEIRARAGNDRMHGFLPDWYLEEVQKTWLSGRGWGLDSNP